jgi:hypothetical protein
MKYMSLFLIGLGSLIVLVAVVALVIRCLKKGPKRPEEDQGLPLDPLVPDQFL